MMVGSFVEIIGQFDVFGVIVKSCQCVMEVVQVFVCVEVEVWIRNEGNVVVVGIQQVVGYCYCVGVVVDVQYWVVLFGQIGVD